MKLNRWQWVGVALSVAWAVGAAIHQRDADLDTANNFSTWAYESCVKSKASKKESDLSSCSKEREAGMQTFMAGSWRSVAAISLLPIPFAWFAAFILLHIFRAQIIGFRAVIPWTTLTLPKKAFVVLSVLSSAFVVLVGLLVALNLYTDTLVPVTLSPFASVVEGGDGYVQAKGTWIHEGTKAASKFDTPLQTSQIVCVREQRRCSEAKAAVSTAFGSFLNAELVEYEIESWSETTIVFKEDVLCPAVIFTIDLKTKSVNGVSYLPKEINEFCKNVYPRTEKEALRLSEGSKVYREEKRKARPFLLRLIQAMFGN